MGIAERIGLRLNERQIREQQEMDFLRRIPTADNRPVAVLVSDYVGMGVIAEFDLDSPENSKVILYFPHGPVDNPDPKLKKPVAITADGQVLYHDNDGVHGKSFENIEKLKPETASLSLVHKIGIAHGVSHVVEYETD